MLIDKKIIIGFIEEQIKELLEIILGLKTSDRKSTLQLALSSARCYCGYEAGKPYNSVSFTVRQNCVELIKAGISPFRNSDEGDLFLSLFLYLNCLEQIGNLFCPVIESDKNGIVRSIKKFAPDELDEDEINILAGLRHALAHSFGLVNLSLSGKPKHKYQLSLEDSDRIIRKEITPWSGDYSEKSEGTSVIAYVFSIIRLSERIFNELLYDYNRGRLNLILGDEEVKSCFTIIYD